MTLKNKNLIKQSNALTMATYSLKRNEKRIIYLALKALCDNELVFDKKENGYVLEIMHQDYGKFFNESKHASRDIHAAAKGLAKKSIVFYVPSEDGEDGERATKERNWATGLDHLPKQSKTILYLNKPVMDLIPYKKGDSFTQYLLANAAKIHNPYAMRLYESICQWRASKNELKHEVDWMLDRFGMPKSYTRMPDFRSKFLAPAIEEINTKTDIKITDCMELKEGTRKNTVTHILFKWTEKVKISENLAAEPTKVELPAEYAAITYSDIENGTRLPSREELDNLKSNIFPLLAEGFDCGPSFMLKILAAEKALDTEK